MKKIYFVLFLLIGLSAMAVAQHNCPFNVEFTTQDATCFNNGKVVFTVYDDAHNEISLANLVTTTDIMQVRGYWKRPAAPSLPTSPTKWVPTLRCSLCSPTMSPSATTV